MAAEVRTCPDCGALIVPQLARCRRCGRYLHGTRLEAWLIEGALGGAMSHSPGTALLCLAIALYYVLMVVLAGPDSVLGFTSFSLTQLGATHGPSILRGEHWRFVTSVFGHHDLLHVSLNLWCLVAAGRAVEALYDRKKLVVLYVLAGVASMMVSHVWYVHVRGGPLVTVVSAGASGAVCGMIGAAWVGAWRQGPDGAELMRRMRSWSVLMLVWGFAVPGVNNAAHLGGFAVGAALARLTPLGLTSSVRRQWAMSLAMLACLGLVLAATATMLLRLRGQPAHLEHDVEPRAIFGAVYAEGAPVGDSDQLSLWGRCKRGWQGKATLAEARRDCELNVLVNDHEAWSYLWLADVLDRGGEADDAARLRDIARRLDAGAGAPDDEDG